MRVEDPGEGASREREHGIPEPLAGYLGRTGKRRLLSPRAEVALARRASKGDECPREEFIEPRV